MYNNYIIKANNFIKKNYKNIYLNNSFNLKGAPSCGDMIYINFFIFNNLIYNVNYKIYGCSSAISSVYIFNKFIIYKNIYKIGFVKNNFVSKYLNLSHIKFHCSIMCENSIKNLILNYKFYYIFINV